MKQPLNDIKIRKITVQMMFLTLKFSLKNLPYHKTNLEIGNYDSITPANPLKC